MYSNIDDLISETVTHEEVADLLSQLSALRQSIFKTGGKDLKYLLETEVGVALAAAIKADMAELVDKYSDSEFLMNLFNGIESKLKSIPVIGLELAFEPSRVFLKQVKENLTGFFGRQAVIALIVDPGVIGGARITFGGKYADFSLATKWDEVWKEIETRLK